MKITDDVTEFERRFWQLLALFCLGIGLFLGFAAGYEWAIR